MKSLPTTNYAPPYHIRKGLQVEAWSTRRLPFEPKGWQLAFRNDLRTAVASLAAEPEQILHAIYVSMDRTQIDVENVLFYNVGTRSFTRAARFGLRFERLYARPPSCPISLANKPTHYHRYSLRPVTSSFIFWNEGTVLAQWNSILESAMSINRCASVWYDLKRGSIMSRASGKSPPRQFGLRVTLAVPRGKDVRPASTMKPVFDGIISTFHHHNGSNNFEVGKRLAKQLNANPDTLIALLCNSKNAVLGKRQLVKLWGNSLQWNPGDDYCLAGELRMENVDGHGEWLLHGEIFEITSSAGGSR